jgi:hypothetical protein
MVKRIKKRSLPNRNSYLGYRIIYSFLLFGDEYWNRHGPNVDNPCHPTKLLKYILKDICFNSHGGWAYHLSILHWKIYILKREDILTDKYFVKPRTVYSRNDLIRLSQKKTYGSYCGTNEFVPKGVVDNWYGSYYIASYKSTTFNKQGHKFHWVPKFVWLDFAGYHVPICMIQGREPANNSGLWILLFRTRTSRYDDF